ncbi:MAG: hypothetical protein ACT4PP_14955 [Sporichthyaceae bacterium]
MADEVDPGADTDMFRAFVEREQAYQPPSRAMVPVLVAAVAVVIAVALFFVIIARG